MRARRELQPLLHAAGLADGQDRAQARRAYLGSVSRNERLQARARQVLDAAEEAGLTLLPYKGALLAERYGDVGMRPMVDLDLLARPDEIARASELLQGLGFRRTFAEQRRFRPEHAHDVSFTDERGPDLVLELHYRLFHELALDGDVEPIFARAIAAPALGRTRRLPAWDDHLMAVALHAATHALGDQPLWPFDLAILVETGGPGVIARAQAAAERRRGGFAFRAAWRAATRLLPSLLPPLSPVREDSLRLRALDQLVGEEPLAQAPSRLRSLLARALLTERPSDALGEIARKAGLRLAETADRARGRGAPFR